MLNISAVIVDSRGDIHPEWVEMAVQSIKDQFRLPDEVVMVENRDRSKTIGECYNLAVKQAKGDYIVFLDDDDWWARDYIQLLETYAINEPNYIAWTTWMMAYNDYDNDPNRGKFSPLVDRIHRGLWKRDYLLKYPYDETLPKGIDRVHIEEVRKRGDRILALKHYFGYYYRKHSDYSCAIPINFSMEFKDILIVATQKNFIVPIRNKIGGDKCSIITQPFTPVFATNAKVIWCEWGNENAIAISKFETEAKKILRIHAYEVYGANLSYIKFDGFDKVIFIAPHIKRFAESKVGKIENAVIIKNGINLEDFPFIKKEKNNKIAWAGYIGRKKGIDLLMHLANENPDYEFHVAGKYDEEDIADWINNKKPDNFILHEWQYDIKEFFKDKTYILNTSPREGCPVTVLEGMAMGLKPILNDWIGADEQFGKEYVFKNAKEFRQILESDYEPEKYRKFIEDNHDLDKIYENEIKPLLGE